MPRRCAPRNDRVGDVALRGCQANKRVNIFNPESACAGAAQAKETFRFLLSARMLWDKGVGDYVEAARLLKQRYPHAEFCLPGFLDVKNPAAISREQMSAWSDEGVIRYLGVTDDMNPNKPLVPLKKHNITH